MKHILEYINEMLLLEEEGNNDEKIIKLKSKILDALKKKGNLTEFVDILNSILEHADKKDNGKIWYTALKQLFDGQKEDDSEDQKYETTSSTVPVSELFPTQSEIDIVNSAKWVNKPKDGSIDGNINDIMNKKTFGDNFGVPVLVYDDGSKKWLIDGHHRWSQVGLLNPSGSLDCMVVKGKSSAQEFLKLTQGAIASVFANRKLEDESKNVKLPVGKAAPENNIFGDSLKGDKLAARIKEMIEKAGTGAELVEAFKKQQDRVNEVLKAAKHEAIEIKSVDDIAKLVETCRDIMIERKQVPEKWAAPRVVMPQSDQAGKDKSKNDGDKVTADAEGSALNLISKGEFPKLK